MEIALYTILGEEVTTVFNGDLEARRGKTFRIDAGNAPSGIYVLHIVGETFGTAKAMTVIR